NGTDATAAAAPAPPGEALEELGRIEADLRGEMDTLSRIEARLATEAATGGAGGDEAEGVAVLHGTLAGFRARAARLRDEIDGCRRRVESLSPAELSGFLEEIGEDLAELTK